MCDIPREEAEELSTAQLKKAIRDAAQLGAQTIVFSGGEPLVRNDICGLIFYAKAQGLDACLTSNGTLINDALAAELAKVRVNVVNVSLEGPEQIHDSLRGQGSFKKALSALDTLHKCGVESTVAATVSRYNYGSLPFIIEAAHAHKATTVRFQPFSTIFIMDRARGQDFFIDQTQRERLEEGIKEAVCLARKYGISINPESYLEKIPAYLAGHKIVSQRACSALWQTCPINARGDVFLCWVLNSQDGKIGNVKDQGLVDLWFSRRHERLRREVIQKGCGGCLMSCYDEVFGQERAKITALKLRRMPLGDFFRRGAQKLRHVARGEAVYLFSRYRFYVTYRGSIRQLGRRLWNKMRRPPPGVPLRHSENIRKVADQIEAAKQKLRSAIAAYK